MSGWADNDMENGGLSGKGGKSGPPVKHPKDKKQPTPETTVRGTVLLSNIFPPARVGMES